MLEDVGPLMLEVMADLQYLCIPSMQRSGETQESGHAWIWDEQTFRVQPECRV